MTIQSAGVIAAGEGSRFKQAGMNVHKPMISVGGFPLIGHTLRNFEAAGIRRAVIIFNEAEEACVGWVRKNFPSLACEFIVKSTDSSFESFRLVGARLGAGRHLLSTVDSITVPAEVKKMIEAPVRTELDVLLGVVSKVDDVKPLWVEMAGPDHRIRAVGVARGEFATAGFYNVSDKLFALEARTKFASLRLFLKWVAEQDVPVYGVPLESVVDVDFPRDIAIAEDFLKKVSAL